MRENGMESLHSFLNGEGRELNNIKFFPGTGRGNTKERMEAAAKASIHRALLRGDVNRPPMSGRQKASI